MSVQRKVPIKEKVGYALGYGAANIAWRGVATFLFIYYTEFMGGLSRELTEPFRFRG